MADLYNIIESMQEPGFSEKFKPELEAMMEVIKRPIKKPTIGDFFNPLVQEMPSEEKQRKGKKEEIKLLLDIMEKKNELLKKPDTKYHFGQKGEIFEYGEGQPPKQIRKAEKPEKEEKLYKLTDAQGNEITGLESDIINHLKKQREEIPKTKETDIGIPIQKKTGEIVPSQFPAEAEVEKPAFPFPFVKGKKKEEKEQYDLMEKIGDPSQQKYLTKGKEIPIGWKVIKTPAAEVKIDIGTKGMTKISEEMGKKIIEENKEAVQAYTSLEQLQDAKKLLKSGMITGFGAEYIVGFGKALQQIGFNIGENPITNTEAYASQMGRQVGIIIKQFGAGTGLSDADREYAEKIAGGRVTLNKQSLEKIISLNEKALRNVVKNYNKKAKSIMEKPGSSELPYNLMIETSPSIMEEKTIIGTGTERKTGKKVIKYSDGSVEYAK